ncbi:MAG TPA: hypothetical protein VGI99_01890 [Gemmataceae bacterium]|jgi:hypothetical protein
MLKSFSIASVLMLIAAGSAEAKHWRRGARANGAVVSTAPPPVIAYPSGTAFYMGFTPPVSPYAGYNPAPFFGAVPTYGGYPPAYFNGRPVMGIPPAAALLRNP